LFAVLNAGTRAIHLNVGFAAPDDQSSRMTLSTHRNRSTRKYASHASATSPGLFAEAGSRAWPARPADRRAWRDDAVPM